MKVIPIGLIAVAVTASAAEIPANTHVLLRMEHSISSRTANVGDGVHLRTVIPVIANGKIVIPAGSYAQGVVSQVKRSGKGHKNAELQIQLISLISPANEVLAVAPLTTTIESSEPGRRAERDQLLHGAETG